MSDSFGNSIGIIVVCRDKCTNTAGEVVPKLSDPPGPWGPLLLLLKTSEINTVLLPHIVSKFHLFSSLKNSCAPLILKWVLPAWVTCQFSPLSDGFQKGLLVSLSWETLQGKLCRSYTSKTDYSDISAEIMCISMWDLSSAESCCKPNACILNKQGCASRRFFQGTGTLPASLALFISETQWAFWRDFLIT